MSLSLHKSYKSRTQRGFTFIETVVAIFVLTTGLFGVAALMSRSVTTTSNAHYMSVASMLASEKLEDLSRYPSGDAAVAAGGSLTADSAGFFDVVQISAYNGAISETTSGASGTTLYTQQPGANVVVTSGGSLPAATAGTLIFNRRWVIVQGTPVTGVCQITVLVTLTNMPKPVTFQATMVHP